MKGEAFPEWTAIVHENGDPWRDEWNLESFLGEAIGLGCPPHLRRRVDPVDCHPDKQIEAEWFSPFL